MKVLIEKQIAIISGLQELLLKELDKKDRSNRSDIEFYNGQIKVAVEGLDILECLPDDLDEIDEELGEDDD